MNDKQLMKFATSFRRGILGRGKSRFMCFAVCAPLAPLLQINGIKCDMQTGWINWGIGKVNHYWIALDDGRVLDPTADQFNDALGLSLPKVYLGVPAQIHPRDCA